ALVAAGTTLERHGDLANAGYGRLLHVRRLLLVGRVDEAERTLARTDATPLPPASRAIYELLLAGIALRRLRTAPARTALARARHAASGAGISALDAEVERAALALATPAARVVEKGEERVLLLGDVEALLSSKDLVVD